MIKKTFILEDISLILSKVFGHKEYIKTFDTQEECDEFIAKFKQKDPDTLDEIDELADIIVDDWHGIDDYYAWNDEWKILDEEQED